MKRILIITLFSIIATVLKAQSNLPYKPLFSFKNDTIAYLIYNFETRADIYQGKTLGDIVGEIQIPIKYYKFKYTPKGPQFHLRLFYDLDMDNETCIYLSSHTRYLDYVSYKGEWSRTILDLLKSIKVERVSVSVSEGSEHYKQTRAANTPPPIEFQMKIEDSPIFYEWDPDNP